VNWLTRRDFSATDADDLVPKREVGSGFFRHWVAADRPSAPWPLVGRRIQCHRDCVNWQPHHRAEPAEVGYDPWESA
jgi:hypothetical protein